METLSLPQHLIINGLATSIGYAGIKARVKFDGQCWKRDNITFNYQKILNIYIVYEMNLWPFRRDYDFTLVNALFGTVKISKNAEKDKYKYSG